MTDRRRLVCLRFVVAGLMACSWRESREQESSSNVETAWNDSSTEHHIHAEAKNRVIREMAQQLGERYLSSSVGAELERTLLEHLEDGAYDAIADTRELARVLTADLRQVVDDKHLMVTHVPPAPAGSERRPPEAASGIRKVEILPGNIGYLELESVPPLERSKSAIAAAFALLQGTEALIIDNRENHGGDPGTVAYYVSYLSAGPPFVVSRIRFRDDRRVDELSSVDLDKHSYGTERPVFVLDSADTFSGGEGLSYALQALGRAKIVGELTGGGAHPALALPLGHGLVGRIPFARSENPITGSNWESVGVVPDVPISAERAPSEAERLARAAIAERRERLASELAGDARPAVTPARVELPSASRAPSQVLNGDFESGLAPWGISAWSGPLADGEHPHRLDGGVLCFTVTRHARVLVGWPPESSSYALVLERGTRYQLSFKASASGSLPVKVEVTVGHRLPPYTGITTASVALDSNLESFTVAVEPDESDDQAGLAFKVAAGSGEGASEVCLDDVELRAQ